MVESGVIALRASSATIRIFGASVIRSGAERSGTGQLAVETDILLEFTDPASGYCVVFEDDGRVAYGYLIDPGNEIIADVWLYNRCATPREPEWRTPDLLPFANPMEYAKDHSGFRPVENASEVAVAWAALDTSRMRAIITIRGRVFGIMENGTKPGWAFMAAKSGPLARVLKIDETG